MRRRCANAIQVGSTLATQDHALGSAIIILPRFISRRLTIALMPGTRSSAVVLGGEGSGLHRLVRERCDALVRIPVSGRIESLNVSVAAGVVLYEAQRQRTMAKDR